jgi:hypothetical protein
MAKKSLMLAGVCLVLVSCATPEGGVANKVMVDFGLRQKPEGYVSETDKVFASLNGVGATEMKRMNLERQHGAVKFQQQGELKGKYYKEVKVYETFYPTDAQAISRSSEGERGFHGYIEYAYRMYQSLRKDSSTEAQAAAADISTDATGRETYRYTFGASGEWNGGKGEKTRK